MHNVQGLYLPHRQREQSLYLKQAYIRPGPLFLISSVLEVYKTHFSETSPCFLIYYCFDYYLLSNK